MNTFNISSLLYLSFRLAPFIIVSVFSLTSIIHQDFKGLIYLGGLLFTSVFAIMFGNMFDSYFRKNNEELVGSEKELVGSEKFYKCNIFTLADNGPLSSIPLSVVTFSYTYLYLIYIIVKYNLILNNLPTIIIFPILILGEIVWSISNQCTYLSSLFAAIIIGGIAGCMWSYIIDNSGMTNLKFYNGISTQVTCSAPSEPKFKCTFQ